MAAGQRNLKRSIGPAYPGRSPARPWVPIVAIALFVLMTVAVGVVWPAYVIVTILPTDPHTAWGVLALVAGGWLFIGLVFRDWRRPGPTPAEDRRVR